MKSENVQKLIVILIVMILAYVTIVEPLINMAQTAVNQIGVGLQ
jgi:hypothetical protein